MGLDVNKFMKNKQEWITCDCFIFKQGEKGPEMATFVINAYDLQDVATVSRIADQQRGYQRLINPRKLAAVRRYVEVPEAVLPTAIVLATGDKSGFVEVSARRPIGDTGRIYSAKIRIKCSDEYKPLLIIDGQHRLYGITSSKLAQYPVPVTLLLEAGKLVQMAHFEIINNKATRIQTAHLNELRAMMFTLTAEDESKLNSLLGQLGVASLSSSALVSELNGPAMVFEGILDFPSNKAGFVSSNTLRELVEKSRSGGLMKYLPDDDNEDLRAFNAVWIGISKKFSARWKLETDLFQKYADGGAKRAEVKSSQRLLHSASLSVMGSIADNELASSSFRKKWIDEPLVIAELVQREIFANVPDKFWDDPELRIDNTSSGKKDLAKLLEEQMI